MPMYRKKPVVIEARLFDPADDYDEACDVVRWCGGVMTEDGCIVKPFGRRVTVIFGDYIIKGVKGEFYPCEPNVFKQTYEKVEE